VKRGAGKGKACHKSRSSDEGVKRIEQFSKADGIGQRHVFRWNADPSADGGEGLIPASRL